MSLDDQVVVRLEEDPTTGYRWAFEELGGSLELLDDMYSPSGPAIGAGGTRTLTFRAGHAVGRIVLVRRQEWRPGSPNGNSLLTVPS